MQKKYVYEVKEWVKRKAQYTDFVGKAIMLLEITMLPKATNPIKCHICRSIFFPRPKHYHYYNHSSWNISCYRHGLVVEGYFFESKQQPQNNSNLAGQP